MNGDSAKDFHRRGISNALAFLDETLSRFEEWANDRETHSIFYCEHNLPSPEQRNALFTHIASLRRLLQELKDELKLEARIQNASSDIWARCAALREVVMELDSDLLRRHGEVPADVTRIMNASAPKLLEGLDQTWRRSRALPQGNPVVRKKASQTRLILRCRPRRALMPGTQALQSASALLEE